MADEELRKLALAYVDRAEAEIWRLRKEVEYRKEVVRWVEPATITNPLDGEEIVVNSTNMLRLAAKVTWERATVAICESRLEVLHAAMACSKVSAATLDMVQDCLDTIVLRRGGPPE